jgi:hypothetical protein
MKPVHMALLVAGAAIAGGVAVRMTEMTIAPPPAPSIAAVKPGGTVSPPAPSGRQPKETPATDQVGAETAPAPVYEPGDKPKPFRAAAPTRPVPPMRAAEPKREPAREVARAVPYQAPLPIAPENDPKPEPGPAPVAAPERMPEPPPAPVQEAMAPAVVPEARRVNLQSGATIVVRLDQALSSDHAAVGDTFQASLSEPLIVDGLVIAERGARVSGRITDHSRAGRFSGTSLLQLSLTAVQTSDGQKVAITTEPWVKKADAPTGQQAAKIGGGAALGAIIGAIAGGGTGAAIGAGLGGGVGAGAAAASQPKPVTIPSETVIRFRLANRVEITERRL